MITIKSVSIRNFLSIGAITQTINFQNKNLTLILGENLDQGENGSRNGVGKSSILQAICYALYDNPITNIRKDNLINNVNGKNMLVCLDFSKDGVDYRIERGRRKNILKFYINGKDTDELDYAQGENRNTQDEIIKVIGLSYDLFLHTVAMNTYTNAFLFMRPNDQRVVIEELISITQLSEKADVLKKNIKSTKDHIKEEEFKINALKDSNDSILNSIAQIERKSKDFEKNRDRNITDYIAAIESLQHIDINEELELHTSNQNYQNYIQKTSNLNSEILSLEKSVKSLNTRLKKYQSRLESSSKQICPTCNQKIEDDTHTSVHDEILLDIKNVENEINDKEKNIQELALKLTDIEVVEKPKSPFYSSLDKAYQHKQNLNELGVLLEEEMKKSNPYDDQATMLKEESLKEINYDKINSLKSELEHQNFLFKLLTSKDSFVRKKIINQNLPFLNSRMSYYLSAMGLPHDVEFKNDLSVEIVLLGKTYDFGQLSRGQQNRLILSLSWAFRDVWESMNTPINLMFIDEMVDSGIDTVGAENTISILKKLCRERNKEIFLISHKEELINRIDNVLTVTMENGFTTYD